ILGVSAARADDWADCQSKTPAQAVAGCTAFIKKGGRSDREVAQAYRLRAASYVQQNRHDLAVADYDQALKLEPNQTTALIGRGLSLRRSGRPQQAPLD